MIFPDIYLLSGFPFQLHQNVYGIDFPEENRMVLIDTGLDEADRRQIQETMKIWGLEKRRISDVFLTHAHFDHAGNAFWFEKNGARIWAGEADAASIENGDEHTIAFAYGKKFPVCQKVERLKDGEKISLSDSCELICFHTPGHTAGSMCYELVGKGEKVLFTGDFMHEGVNHEDRQRGQNRDGHPDSLRRDGIGYQLIHTCCICGVLDLVCQSLHFIEVIIKQIL